MSSRARAQVSSARRIVVKVGSSSISGDNADQIAPLIEALAETHDRGVEVVLVSSGAVASGLSYLNLDERPADLATQQAAASVGQNVLTARYQETLDRHGIAAGQVLLTEGDLLNEPHRSNTRRAVNRLLDLRIMPIVNENDTVATYGLRFGDNDRLAAMLSVLIRADLLLLLSDVDSLYTRPPHLPGAERIDLIGFDQELAGMEFGTSGAAGVGTGGASTKVKAARLAAAAGTAVLVTATGLAGDALNGAEVGTWFEPMPQAPGRALL
ncbi:glutamate 5-kinase [Cryobacterium sp. TMT1-21]|uniref:Glutamate 5-kinase n=1 Tax=Cryobacterium shii TaxID=1259235 RepID=A0AAQ2C536_9MICO|nr:MULTISPECIES: glutamate 5-kinase [Cryobacterium]TFC43612.1 glutamate 5-kinase [Cryobacterium shii]TFD13725.1 glutamate 5-kinase [Cryobacterium sp. TMT4-10]TFD15910.1 glutamate 5-kinase [Cryobacterium sp. TMT1-21]TFD19758.1 glutamate 5-kinase [Cryobacterium sp. TMT2-23]TFD39855.1 glutamate 5-kinase [Cryobacterium sp. TMT2-10]